MLIIDWFVDDKLALSKKLNHDKYPYIIISFITSVNKTTQQDSNFVTSSVIDNSPSVNLIVIKPVILFATIIKFPLLLCLQRRFSLPLPRKWD